MKIKQLFKNVKMPSKPKYCGAVIVAAGSASRMKGVDKIMVPINGEPMIRRTVRAFEQCELVQEIVVVTRADLVAPIMDACRDFNKLTAVVVGGDSRDDSVSIGLNALSKKVRLAAVHDGARPFASAALIEKTIRAGNYFGAAAPAITVKDTIKVTRGGMSIATPDREDLRAVQTPQVFDCDLLKGALVKAKESGAKITDDCSAVELLGMNVRLIEGEESNIKITTPLDLKLAHLIAEEEQ